MWRNDGETPVYAVKRQNAEIYHTGSCSSVMPKMYKIGNAKSVCKQLNSQSSGKPLPTDWETISRSYDYYRSIYSPTKEEMDGIIEKAQTYAVEQNMAGPWVVVTIQLTAGSEIA